MMRNGHVSLVYVIFETFLLELIDVIETSGHTQADEPR